MACNTPDLAAAAASFRTLGVEQQRAVQVYLLIVISGLNEAQVTALVAGWKPEQDPAVTEAALTASIATAASNTQSAAALWAAAQHVGLAKLDPALIHWMRVQLLCGLANP